MMEVDTANARSLLGLRASDSGWKSQSRCGTCEHGEKLTSAE